MLNGHVQSIVREQLGGELALNKADRVHRYLFINQIQQALPQGNLHKYKNIWFMKYYDMNIDTWISVASAAGSSVMLAVWHDGHLSQFL